MSDFCLPLLMLPPVSALSFSTLSTYTYSLFQIQIKDDQPGSELPLCSNYIPHTHLYHRANNVLPYLFTNLYPLLDSKLLEVRQFLVFDNPNTRHWAGPIADAPQAWWISFAEAFHRINNFHLNWNNFFSCNIWQLLLFLFTSWLLLSDLFVISSTSFGLLNVGKPQGLILGPFLLHLCSFH